jgi:hypothetical protein
MIGRGIPERLRTKGANARERRILDATAHERPDPELRKRMAQALGVSASILGASAGAAPAAGSASTQAAAGAVAATSQWSVWISVGVVGLLATGIYVGARTWRTHGRGASNAAPAVAVVEPPTRPAALPSPMDEPPQPAIAAAPAEPTLAPAKRPRATAAPSDLREQTSLVDAARAAMTAGALERALDILRKYQSSYPNGLFRPETSALRIETLSGLGRTGEARALAERFVAEYGSGPLSERVARIAGLQRP